jgi:hypothetical protein
VGAGERAESAGDVRVAQLISEVRARRQAEKPDAADSFGAETFAQDGVAGAGLFCGRDLGAIECFLNLAQDGRFEAGAKRGPDDGWIYADFC